MDPITLALILAAAGGGIGALSNKKHPLKGALIGAGAGALGGAGLGAAGIGVGAAAAGAGAGTAAAGAGASAASAIPAAASGGFNAMQGIKYANMGLQGMTAVRRMNQQSQLMPQPVQPIPMMPMDTAYARPMAPPVQMGGFYA